MTEASGQEDIYHSGMSSRPDSAPPPAVPAAVAAGRVEELYEAHARLVRSVCRSLLRDRHDAEDAAQQTFLSAQRALANGSTPREPVAWLATIARNECLARVRERMREPLPVDAEPTATGADAYAAAVSNHEVATLREALADLPRAQREAILLRELRGFSYDEVARALSVTTAAVESLIFRARRTLQTRLSEALPAFSPVALFGRLFGSAGGDVVAPVAKVAVVGVGAALLAGGAAVGPHGLGLGTGTGTGKTHRSSPAVHDAAVPAVASLLPSPAVQRPSVEPTDTHAVERESSTPERASSDVAEGSGTESASPAEKETETASTPTAGSQVTQPAVASAGEPAEQAESGDRHASRDQPDPPDPPEPAGD